ncbi:MAG: winged helix-turn-helix domain-containing protein [Candidatus Micrarchaeia archaeon]
MKNALPLVLLLLALPLAYPTSSASFSTGAASLPENIGMDGHFGDYTLVAFSSAGKVTVAIYGAGESPSALASEIEWLAANEKFYTVCDIDAMPALAYGQEAYCDANGTWAGEGAKAPSPRSAIMQDNGMGIAATGISGAPSEKAADASLAQHAPQEGIGITQMLQLLGAFLAVLVASYLILQGRQEPAIDAATEKLLSHPTRAGIMEELASSDKIPTDISTRLGKSKAAVVEHLQALSGAGLVERVATPGKKFVFYKLTQKGRQALLRRAG